MPKEYIEQREGGDYVAGSRVSLDSLVYAFLRGESPEGIAESFPALTLEQVYGAIAFYLANRDQIDAYLRAGEQDFESPASGVSQAASAPARQTRSVANIGPQTVLTLASIVFSI